MVKSVMVPVEIRLAKHKQSLSISWEDGSQVDLPADILRAYSQSAKSKRQAISNEDTPVMADISRKGLSIKDIQPIGTYAIQIIFSDGYDRGIYPWSYLYDLGNQHAHKTDLEHIVNL